MQLSQPFAFSLTLSDYVERYLYAADLLDLPAQTVYALFQKALKGPFGTIVNREIQGHVFGHKERAEQAPVNASEEFAFVACAQRMRARRGRGRGRAGSRCQADRGRSQAECARC